MNGPSDPEGAWYNLPGELSDKGRFAVLHCSYANRPPQISGRAQDTTRGGSLTEQ
ncbi:MAG: hypothetical protein LC657_15835 [Desulfobacteraceae bacterium]|nr:hypothetical protein [Desulfobacteraceae bacterium]